MANIGKVVTVTIDASDTMLDPGLISAKPDSHILLVFVNNGTTKHRVHIKPSGFAKKKTGDADDPVDRFSVFWANVEKDDIGAIIFRIKPETHFGHPSGHKHEYKFDIFYSGKKLDPEIDINN